MGSIPAVWPGGHVTAGSCRSSWAPVTGGATIAEARSKRIVDINVLIAIELYAALPFRSDKFALEQLPSATHGAKRVALDDEHGRAGHGFEAASWPDLLDKGLVNAFVRHVGHAVFVN